MQVEFLQRTVKELSSYSETTLNVVVIMCSIQLDLGICTQKKDYHSEMILSVTLGLHFLQHGRNCGLNRTSQQQFHESHVASVAPWLRMVDFQPMRHGTVVQQSEICLVIV